MFFSADQIVESVKRLESINPFFGTTFLVFKKGGLPVGTTTSFQIDADNKEFLEKYYRPDEQSSYFFRVFRPSDKSKHWNRPDYAAKGLQSINTRRFGDAFIHERDSSIWGWKPDYIDILERHLGTGNNIPILDLAVWLYLDRNWADAATAQDVISAFKDEFIITDEEERRLFEHPALFHQLDFQPDKATWQELREMLDANPPPDFKPEEGGILRLLELQGVGAAKTISFEPANRLNLITGDNGLGKTFLLECAWWALTGDWADQAAHPRNDAKINEPKISFLITGEQKSKPISIQFDRDANAWPSPKKRPTIPGLIVYARVDGSFAVWDPMMNRHLMDAPVDGSKASRYLVFTREQVWEGRSGEIEGLLRDWVRWQVQPEKFPFGVFLRILERLSPPDFKLEPGEPVRLPRYSMEIPALRHPYGEVPIVFESAGVRRIITLAYLIVWAWNEHKINSAIARKEPQSNLVVLVDEMEAHLHPKWQRSVLRMQPEPGSFADVVRKPGQAFLKSLARKPTYKDFKKGKAEYWQQILPELYKAYGGICAYSAHTIPSGTATNRQYESVDHFISKGKHPDLAYEWSNYRLAMAKINNEYKRDTDWVMDPFHIKHDWFILDFATFRITPNPGLPKYLKNHVVKTIEILRLNRDNNLVETRVDVLRAFSEGYYTFEFLDRRYPFIAYELKRQSMETKIKVVFDKSSPKS